MKVLYLTPGCFDKGGISRYSRYQIMAFREIAGKENIKVLSLLGPDQDGFETPFKVAWHGASGNVTIFDRIRFTLQCFKWVILWRPHVISCAHVNFTPLVHKLAIFGAKTLLNVYGLELWSGLSPARRKNMARMNYVIADCHATADHVISERMHADRPFVIWDCADLKRFKPGSCPDHVINRYGLPDPSQYRVALTLGRLAVAARHKGYDRLLESWVTVQSRLPQARLIIAGRGDDADRLRQKAVTLGVLKTVTFAGSIEEGDLASIYLAAHLFVLVSDKGHGRGEGIPLTPIEALASGLPVLVGNEDGSPEAVDGSRNGIVVSSRSLSEITDALIKLLSADEKAHALRVNEARKVAEERFGYDAFVQKHSVLMEKIFNRRFP